MTVTKPKLVVLGADETVHPFERCVFFGRLSDMTLLPDWFPEDEEINKERFKERWRFISGRFPEEGLGLSPNQHTKIFLSTDDKRVLYAEMKEIKVVISRLSAGLAKLVICDGYPKEILDSFGWNIVRSIQMKQTSSTESRDIQRYNLLEHTHSLLTSDFLVATSDALYFADIENKKLEIRDQAKERAWRFVDMTRPDWTKTYFPELHDLIVSQENYMKFRSPMGGFSLPPQPQGSGNGEPPIDGGMLN